MTPRQLDALRSKYDAEYKTGEPHLEPLFVGDWGPLPKDEDAEETSPT